MRRKINTHRAILMAGSAYDFQEKPLNDVSLGNSLEFNVLEMLVKFLYTEELAPTSSAQLRELLIAADYLQMGGALKVLRGKVVAGLSASKVFYLWAIRSVIECEETLSEISCYILSHFLEIVDNISFLTIEYHTIFWILESDDLQVPSEQEAFQTIRSLINHDYASRVKHLPSLLRCVDDGESLSLFIKIALISNWKPFSR